MTILSRSSSSAAINWGIVAPGRIAHKFAQDLALVPGARLHAVASRSLSRAKEFATQYNAPYHYGSYEEMTACPGLDVVYIASPHTGHHPHTLLFLENKIAVLCEKPLAINSGQVAEMTAAARANDTFLMEAIWTRFIPVFEKTIELVENSTIGRLNFIRADFGFKAPFDPKGRLFDPALGGGSLLDVGLYPVFAATCFFGKPLQIQALAAKGGTGTDDSCGMVFTYPGERLALLDSSVVHHTDTRAVLYGEKGRIEIHPRFHESERATISVYGQPDEVIHLPKTGFGYYHEIEAVQDCLLNGKRECEKLPLSFSSLLMENLDAVRRAAGIVYPGFD